MENDYFGRMKTKVEETERRPVTIVAIGAGNRTNKYLEYVNRNPDKLRLVGVVELNDVRRHDIAVRYGLDASRCFSDYKMFFSQSKVADAVMVCTPENKHFEPAILAIQKGYHVLLEKPIARTFEECLAICRAAEEKGVLVSVCHVLRYHPYFMKIKQLIDSGGLGEVISINHCVSVGVDRSTHSFVRGMWRNEKVTNPMLISKCCHDIDLLLWLTQKRCQKIASFGSLRWFKADNAPIGASDRCVSCAMEKHCPYSAVNLYRERREWIANFDVLDGQTIDDAIEYQLCKGLYGRCVYHCDNNVVDHQIVSMEMENAMTVNISMDIFTLDDNRKTHICLTEGEIDGDETTLRVRRFRSLKEDVYDFSDIHHAPFHAGADLSLIADFTDAIKSGRKELTTGISQSIESHRICFEAERSRREGCTLLL